MSCFLEKFERIYTLNYDVLLYWTLMQDEVDDVEIQCDDGFRHPEGDEDAPYVSWQEAQSMNVQFLHGALHLFDAGHELHKYTWSKTDIPIVDQIRTALDEDRYPLFVSEGHSDAKMEKIMHSAYLHKALRSFSEIGGNLFIFGHSLDPSDQHILHRLETGKINNLFVSLHGDPSSESNEKIIARANQMVAVREESHRRISLSVNFYDAASATVWGDA